ncbi:hypothetical protein [Pontibacillus salipaludis]|uniref:Lipoprotein n=1 Tax=Pontibacillus salipaludis TaxID=1697394 RepID=A0ABQ1Q676_9BACI|nr:hypothetical protein [Pontibacillus salipaludis]GGD13563.1 hypothetical protein GCM10011389_21480 [Pontibacillus salipaludis]
MKKITIILVVLVVTLLGCSKKEADLPYALSAKQHNIIYVVPKQGNEDKLQWFQEFQNEHMGVNLIAFGLELTQEEYPSLEVTEAPYIYILDQDNIAFEGADFERAKSYLIENVK